MNTLKRITTAILNRKGRNGKQGSNYREFITVDNITVAELLMDCTAYTYIDGVLTLFDSKGAAVFTGAVMYAGGDVIIAHLTDANGAAVYINRMAA